MTVHGDGTLIACRTCSKGTRARYRFVDTEAHHGDWSDASVEAFLLKRLMTALQLHMFVSLDCTPADHVQGRMSFLLLSQLLFWHKDPGTPKHQGEVNRLSSPDLWRCPTLMMFAFHCKGQQKQNMSMSKINYVRSSSSSSKSKLAYCMPAMLHGLLAQALPEACSEFDGAWGARDLARCACADAQHASRNVAAAQTGSRHYGCWMTFWLNSSLKPQPWQMSRNWPSKLQKLETC